MNRARLAVALVLALLAAGAAYARARPLEPHLEITVRRELHQEDRSIYAIRIELRGGEPADLLAIEVLRGPVGIVGPGRVERPAPGTQFNVQVTVIGETTVPAAVRIVQTGRVDRTYEVDLEEWRLR